MGGPAKVGMGAGIQAVMVIPYPARDHDAIEGPGPLHLYYGHITWWKWPMRIEKPRTHRMRNDI